MRLCVKSKKPIFLQDINGGISYKRTFLVPFYVEDRETFFDMMGRSSTVPLDNYLGVNILPFEMTLSMMARCAAQGVNSRSFSEASATLKKQGYKRVSPSIISQVCEVVGQAILDYYNLRAADVKARLANGLKIGPANVDIHKMDSLNPEKVLLIYFDGHTIYTRKYSTGRYDIDDGGKCGCDCRVGIAFKLSDCFIEHDEAGRETVRIIHKNFTALIGPKEEFRNYIGELALRSGADQCELIVNISDGADWLHKMVDELFCSSVHIRDFWHAIECTAEYCKALFPDNPEKGSQLTDSLCKLLDEGKIDEFLKELEPYKDHQIYLNGSKLVNPYGYVYNRRDGMEYDLYKSLGLPVGSGAIESTNKIFHRRMRTTGALWTKQTANRMVMIVAANEEGGEELITAILIAMKEDLLDIKARICEEGIHREYKKQSKNKNA